MTYFMKNGNKFTLTSEDNIDIRTELPAATFSVKENIFGYFLEEINDFHHTGKVYGDTPKTADRIYQSFKDRPATTGVLLSGDKGSGKTMLAKLLSERGVNEGLPTLVINQALEGENFNVFMQSIDQPCVVIFDEFEKVYDKEQQARMLTLLDGIYPSKKLFILTCNDVTRIDQHMLNRPGRLFYSIDYSGLTLEFIREYAEDTLNNKEHVDAVVTIGATFPKFSMDMLKALVEESNRFGESPFESIKLLNAKPQGSGEIGFDMTVTKDGVVLREDTWYGNPLAPGAELEFSVMVTKRQERDEDGKRQWGSIFFDDYTRGRSLSEAESAQVQEWIDEQKKTDPYLDDYRFMAEYELTHDNFVKVDPIKGTYILQDPNEGITVHLTKQKPKVVSYYGGAY